LLVKERRNSLRQIEAHNDLVIGEERCSVLNLNTRQSLQLIKIARHTLTLQVFLLKDLTQGSIAKHLAGMAFFIGAGLISQTIYLLVDLYFVARIGSKALAGVASAGAYSILILALVQTISVGSQSLLSQASGKKNQREIEHLLNQSLSLSICTATLTLLLGYTIGALTVSWLASDPEVASIARLFFVWYLPCLACQFPAAVLMSAARSMGIVISVAMIQVASLLLNALLAPVLITGVVTGVPWGVAGGAFASSLSVGIGLLAAFFILPLVQQTARCKLDQMRPDLRIWSRLAHIGLPAGGELVLMFLNQSVVYAVIRRFGSTAQAGYGLGFRVTMAILLPAIAVGLATTPVAGQNLGLGRRDRVRKTLAASFVISSILMAIPTILCQTQPKMLVSFFTADASVASVAANYLTVVSWSFIASGLVSVCGGLFQALGDTSPSLLASAIRLVALAVPFLALKSLPDVSLVDFWWMVASSVILQAIAILLLVYRKLSSLLECSNANLRAH
jgi:putative MATE family efflux protein